MDIEEYQKEAESLRIHCVEFLKLLKQNEVIPKSSRHIPLKELLLHRVIDRRAAEVVSCMKNRMWDKAKYLIHDIIEKQKTIHSL